MNKIEVHLLCCDEAPILKYALRHYATFASSITVHDLGSTDGSIEVAHAGGAMVRNWDSNNQVVDRVNMRIKNECWRGTDADWVMCVDADELIWFRQDPDVVLTNYLLSGVPLIRPRGYEMTSEEYPTTEHQIYDEVKYGGRDDHWYAKPCIFSPIMVREVDFAPGAHDIMATLKSGEVMRGEVQPIADAVYLLHFHQIGPIERIAQKYDRMRSRMCQANVEHRWGNFEPGIKHATDKRNAIKSRLERVIP